MTEKSQSTTPRRTRLHPMRDRIAALAARHVASPAEDTPVFEVAVPQQDDLVIRFLDVGSRETVEVSVVRAEQGKLTVFANRLVEVELIGTKAERTAVAQAARQKGRTISVSAIRRAIRRRRTLRLGELPYEQQVGTHNVNEAFFNQPEARSKANREDLQPLS